MYHGRTRLAAVAVVASGALVGVTAPAHAEPRVVQHVQTTYTDLEFCGFTGTEVDTGIVSQVDEYNYMNAVHASFVSDTGYQWAGYFVLMVKDWGPTGPTGDNGTAITHWALHPIGKDASTRPTFWLSVVNHVTIVNGAVKADPSRFVVVECR